MHRRRRRRSVQAGAWIVFFLVLCLSIFGKKHGKEFWQSAGDTLKLQVCSSLTAFCIPQMSADGLAIGREVMSFFIPSISCHSDKGQSLPGDDQTDYLLLAEQENRGLESMLAENEVAAAQLPSSGWGDDELMDLEEETVGGNASKGGETGNPDVPDDSKASGKSSQNPRKQASVNRKKLSDFDYLYQTFYQVDSTTTIGKDQLNAEDLLGKDMTLKSTKGDAPQILIYHTHSQETYKGCKEGDPSTSVVGVGDYLTELLTNYGYKVLHHKGEYDVEDRDHAYTYALPALQEILEEYPSIQVIIDLHRDSVPERSHLVTEVNGKPTAQLMFFNGMSHTTALGDLDSLPNPNRPWNLAFSFQMQLAAAEYYPGLTRRIYLKGYRYNMHLRAQSMLVEVGAQNNTFEEARNAMEPLSVLLHEVLSGHYSN